MFLKRENAELSLRKRLNLLGLWRSSFYYQPVPESPLNLKLMDLLDRQYLKTPFYGSRRMTAYLRSLGYEVNRKRTQRLMRKMGIEAIYPKQNTSAANKDHHKYPYLLREVDINRSNQVWSTDITYIRLKGGFVYLTAIIDWHSRYVLSWKLSNSLDAIFCVETLEEALNEGIPDIFNTDQGSQYTSDSFISVLKKEGIKISMNSKGRCLDNVFVERLWRSLKYEEVYLKDYQSVMEAESSIDQYFKFYNHERFHQSLNYKTPKEIHFESLQ